MTATLAAPSGARRAWAVWTAGALAFPIAGLAGRAVGGQVDDLVAAALGGAVTGLVLGLAQAVLGRGVLPRARWITGTALGMGAGLALGAATVGYGTSLADLTLMGLLTGIPLGIAQALALPPSLPRRWRWAVAMPPLWGLGWATATLIGVGVGEQFTVFGISGALVVSALSGVLLVAMQRPAAS